jgi:hypothetical protein
MRAYIRLVIAAVLAASLTARASTFSSEITDMWWNPAESGWGVNVILQNSVVFMTFFIYDQNQNPIWYTAQLNTTSGSSVWTGALYATKGPYFGGPFTPPSTIRQAGTATFNVTALDAATLTYSVDGVVVVKNLVRQTWTNENFTGSYVGGYSLRYSSCNPASGNGISEVAELLSISQVGTAMTISTAATAANCTYTGAYSQTGKLGGVQGNYTCSDGTQGTFTWFEMTPTISGFTARATGQNQFCQWSGFIGGITRAQ